MDQLEMWQTENWLNKETDYKENEKLFNCPKYLLMYDICMYSIEDNIISISTDCLISIDLFFTALTAACNLGFESRILGRTELIGSLVWRGGYFKQSVLIENNKYIWHNFWSKLFFSFLFLLLFRCSYTAPISLHNPWPYYTPRLLNNLKALWCFCNEITISKSYLVPVQNLLFVSVVLLLFLKHCVNLIQLIPVSSALLQGQ